LLLPKKVLNRRPWNDCDLVCGASVIYDALTTVTAAGSTPRGRLALVALKIAIDYEALAVAA